MAVQKNTKGNPSVNPITSQTADKVPSQQLQVPQQPQQSNTQVVQSTQQSVQQPTQTPQNMQPVAPMNQQPTTQQVSGEVIEQDSEGEKPSLFSKWWFWVILVLGVLLIVGGVLFFWLT